MFFLLLRRWVVLGKLLLLLLLAGPTSSINPQTSTSSATVHGGLLSVTSWHARTLTNVSWEIPLVRQNASHIIAFTWDEEATEEAWWLADTDNVSRTESPPSSPETISSDTSITSGSDDFLGQAHDIRVSPYPCTSRPSAFHSQSTDAFNTDAARQHTSVDLADERAWWYTATLRQEMPDTTSLTSGVGNASVLLSEPGFYSACLLMVIGSGGDNKSCSAEECLDFTVYQPPYDFLEVGGQTLSMLTLTTCVVSTVDPTFVQQR